MDTFKQFQQIIKQYAKAYLEFENFQKDNLFVPTKGDQKTGVIGEAYIYQYLIEKGKEKLEFGSGSEKAWDIKDGEKKKYQVKTVSAYSKTQRISPIHKGWDYLYLVHLTKEFLPDKVLLIKNPNQWNQEVTKNLIFPNKSSLSIGGQICHIEDITDEFKKLLEL